MDDKYFIATTPANPRSAWLLTFEEYKGVRQEEGKRELTHSSWASEVWVLARNATSNELNRLTESQLKSLKLD